MSGRPKIFDRDEVLDKAIAVFWKYGYYASSTEILLEHMGIGKSSFYLAFPGGKRELFELCLERRSDLGLENMKKNLAKSGNKVLFLKSLFQDVLNPKSERFKNGCLMGNTVAELSNQDPELKEKAAFFLQRLEMFFLEVLRQAKEEGSFSGKQDPAFLAQYLITVWNGLNISVRAYPNPDKLKPILENQLSLLDS